MKQWSLELGLVYGMAAFIAVINQFLKVFLHQVVAFEKKHTVSKALASSISKMWFLQFFNIAIIQYLINSKYEKIFTPRENDLIFAGKYKDFTNNWYQEVGVTIAITACITCVFPVINLSKFLIEGLKRCCDRKCSCDSKKTHQLL